MLNLNDLKKAAKELNDVLGLGPPIPTTKISAEDLKKKMLMGIDLINPELDEFTEETEGVIQELKEDLNTSEEPEEEPEEETKEEIAERIHQKNIGGKKLQINTDVEEEPEEEKKEVKQRAKKDPPAVKGASLQKTRASVMRDILLSGPYTQKEMIEEMQRRYGGSRNEASFQVSSFLRILVELNLIEPDDEDKNRLKYVGNYNG